MIVMRNILLGILSKDEQSGVETFVLNAGLETITLNERDCKRIGLIFYHGECIKIPNAIVSDEVKEEPVMINGKLMYYIYVQTRKSKGVGIV